MSALLLALVLNLSPEELLEGAEIGDRNTALSFQTNGKYVGEHKGGKGKTVTKGIWKLKGKHLEVKVASCKGPDCKALSKGYTASVEVVGSRAMTVKAYPDNAPLATGSYYCAYGGCEKRLGVELIAASPKPAVLRYLLDFMIDKNRSRNVTVVWWSREKAPSSKSAVVACKREAERGREAAELVAKDLADLSWFPRVKVSTGGSDCLYDAQVIVGDEVKVDIKGKK